MTDLTEDLKEVLFDIKFNLDFVLLDIQSKHDFDEEDIDSLNEQFNVFDNAKIEDTELKEVFYKYKFVIDNLHFILDSDEDKINEKTIEKLCGVFLNIGKELEKKLMDNNNNFEDAVNLLEEYVIKINKINEKAILEKRKQDIQEYLVFLLNGVKYGIGLTVIHEISVLNMEQITKIPGQKDLLLGVANLRGEVIPLLDMRIWFNTFAEGQEYSENDIILTLKNTQNKVIGIIVDNVQNTIHIDKKDISLSIPEVDINKEYISGFVALDKPQIEKNANNDLIEDENDFIVLLNSETLLNLNDLFK
jgi:purine-binding chemotaxis protein CheW